MLKAYLTQLKKLLTIFQIKKNELFTDSFLDDFITSVINEFGEDVTVALLDDIKEKGFSIEQNPAVNLLIK